MVRRSESCLWEILGNRVEKNRFFLIARADESRIDERQRATAWPMKTADQLHRQNKLIAALKTVTEKLYENSNWKTSLPAVLDLLGAAAGISRVYVFQNSRSDDGQILMSLHDEWIANGIEPQKNSPHFQQLPYETSGFGRWAEIMASKKPILEEIKSLPTWERKRMARQGIKSIALAPIFVNQEWWGFMGADDCRSDQRQFQLIADILQVTAALLGAAIERNQNDDKPGRTNASAESKNLSSLVRRREPSQYKNIIGQSPAMQKVYDFIAQAATTDASVILYGESGTGKELVARAIHQTSNRRSNRFMTVNCGAIPEPILESEFFGYKNGAFTGAIRNKPGILDLADGGTLFLDEVGELTVNIQAKLLRAIEGAGYMPLGGHDYRTPNFRVIAATNKDLKALVKKRRMRDDFYFRIHVVAIELPPLRDRREDIPLLTAHLLEKYRRNGNIIKISAKDLEALTAYCWPGNVRELQNVLHRYVAVGKLELSAPCDTGSSPWEASVPESRNLTASIEACERQLIQRVLGETNWHRGQAASALGICSKTLQRKIKRHGLDKVVQH